MSLCHTIIIIFHTLRSCANNPKVTVNAPALTGLENWYLASQIKNFRDGIRGRHADDLYGLQMGLVANTMIDDQAIEDMVAYISTLENPQQPVTLAQQN